MGRLPKIILMIAAMTAIFLWLSTAFNSCGNKADDPLTDSTELVSEIEDSDLFDDGDDIFEDDGEDIFVDEVDDEAEDSFVVGDEEIETDYTEPEPSYTPPATTTKSTIAATSSHSSEGQYMVIAGNYLVESNARIMMKKLTNLGYPNANIGVFDRSQYHTVIAMRSNSYSAAMEVSNAIKRQGIDCYVKKRQY